MEYSAGMVSCLFWLNETRNTIPFYLENTKVADMRKIAVEQNIYQVRAEDRCRRIAGVAYKRLDALTPGLIELFRDADNNTASIILLISIMKTDLLFFEFMHSVVKKAIQLGQKEIQDSDIKIFFEEKIAQSEVVAGFSESAIAKLKQTYIKILINAGLVEAANTKRLKIPYIDYNLNNLLRQNGYGPYLSTLTGMDYE